MKVEDGTGLADADSYVTLDYADNYFYSRGNAEWEDIDYEEKERLLVVATDYIDSVFVWKGKRKSRTQSLRFPRVNVYDYEGEEIEGIPNALMQSVCDIAMSAHGGTELFGVSEKGGDVISENIGGMLSFTYAQKTKESKYVSVFESVNARLRGMYVEVSERTAMSGKTERG